MVIQSVVRRQQAAIDFAGYYDNLCALQSSAPLPSVKAHLAEGVIDVNADRIRHADWAPVLSALRLNRSLEFVAFRSQYQQQQQQQKQQQQRAPRKQPAVCSKDISYRLCLSLRDCLSNTQALACLELEGIRLRERDCAALGRGLAANSTLKNLSLESARIGDVGVEHLCRALRHAGNVAFLNWSGNGLTWRAVDELGRLISFQATSRHNEAWRDSLRYRRPNFDSMHGLRRISLNNNPLIDDQAAQVLADALKDDLWVKAIDMQGCGVGNAGAKSLLAVLKLNTTLVVLDLRRNHLIDQDLLRALTEQVIVNGDGKESEFKWLKAEPPTVEQSSAAPLMSAASFDRRQAPQSSRVTSGVKRPAFRPAGVGRLRSRSAEPRGGEIYYGGGSEAFWPSANGVAARGVGVRSGRRVGIPWRTAQRASRYKGYPSNHTPGRSHLDEKTSPMATPRTAGDLEFQPRRRADKNVDDDDDFEDVDDEEDEEDATVVSPLVKEMEESPPAPGAIKALKIELANQRRRWRREADRRQRADEEARRLRAENASLKRQLEQQRAREAAGGGAALLQDEELLESIETSFKRFHKFLDILRDAGLGRVVTAAGMDNLPSGLNLADRASATGIGGSNAATAATAETPGPSYRQQQPQPQKQSRSRIAATTRSTPSAAAASSSRKSHQQQQQQKKPKQQQQPKQKQKTEQQSQPDAAAAAADSIQFDDANGDEMYARATRVKRDADQTYDRLRRNLQMAGDQQLLTGDQVLLDLGPSGQQPLLVTSAPSLGASAAAAAAAVDAADAIDAKPSIEDASQSAYTPPPPPVLSPPAASSRQDVQDAENEAEHDFNADDDHDEDDVDEEVVDTGRGGGYSYAESFEASTHSG